MTGTNARYFIFQLIHFCTEGTCNKSVTGGPAIRNLNSEYDAKEHMSAFRSYLLRHRHNDEHHEFPMISPNCLNPPDGIIIMTNVS
jgi:hypothetical protein